MSDTGHGHGHEEATYPYTPHHFHAPKQHFESGKLGVWLFLVTEILFFAGLFCAYTVYRAQHPEVFYWAHFYLDTKLGAANTVVLILSSFTAAWAVRNAQLGQVKMLRTNIILTICGALFFMCVKYVEYSHKFHDGLLPVGREGSVIHFNPREEVWETPDFKKKHPAAAAAAERIASQLAERKLPATALRDEVLGTRGAVQLVPVVDKTDTARSSAPSAKQAPGAKPAEQAVKLNAQATTGTAQPATGTARSPSKSETAAEPAAPSVAGSGSAPKPAADNAVLEASRTAAPTADVSSAAGAVPGAASETASDDTSAHAVVDEPTPEGDASDATVLAQEPAAEAIIADDVWLESQIRALTADERRPLQMAGVIRRPADGPLEFARPAKAGIFFSIYFFMTGLHGVHVLIGIGLWIWMLVIVSKRKVGDKYFGPIDFTALYWHLVDLIWIYLFPMLYLIH